MQQTESTFSKTFLRPLGVYGFDTVEPLILSALITEDPILLIGKAGTGKTFLLNSISEALQLEHRHYNASLISFDDLIGYPYPTADGKNIQFLPTPATIWNAESVLVDELSRCKPEIQNKFFSVIHELRMQGLPLNKLIYRWAAMNPFAFSGSEDEEQYEGSQPLDPALADRFAFVIVVPDWPDLTAADQERVIHPAGENALSHDAGNLQAFLQRVKPFYLQAIEHPSPQVVSYTRIVSGLLTEAGLRISPRRARLLARNITALLCVTEAMGQKSTVFSNEPLFKLVLSNSLPHRAFREKVPEHTVHAAHTQAFQAAFNGSSRDRWVFEFLGADGLRQKIRMLFETSIDKDTKSLGVIQLMGKESITRKALFALSTFPYFNEKELINEEALHTLVEIASAVMDVKGKIEWRESFSAAQPVHPLWPQCQQVLNALPDKETVRKERARHLFLYLLVKGVPLHHPAEVEKELEECIQTIRQQATLKEL